MVKQQKNWALSNSAILHPRLPKWSHLPKTKRIFEILWGKLEMIKFILSDKYMDRPEQGLRLFEQNCVIGLSYQSTRSHFAKKNLKSMHRDKSAKMATWQKKAICHFATVPVHRFQNFFAKWLFFECYERPITAFCSKSISGPVQGCPCTYEIG